MQLAIIRIHWKMVFNVTSNIKVVGLEYKRVYLLLFFIGCVFYVQTYLNSQIDKFFLYLLLLFVLEIFRLSHKLFLDPTNFYFVDNSFFRKYYNTLIFELVGFPIVVLLGFLCLGFYFDRNINLLILYFLVYLNFVVFKTFFGFVGSRYLIFSKVYSWILFVFLGLIIAIVRITQEEKIGLIKEVFGTNLSDSISLNTINLILCGSFFLSFFTILFAEKIFNFNPIPNPYSFPKSLI